jgi:hypothetical protein
MKTRALGAFDIAFSHNQFLIYDVAVAIPQCEWTDEHSRQGFARRESAICLGTILQSGTASVRVYHGPIVPQQEWQRVIANPFSSPTGRIVVRGLMEMYIAHLVQLRPGFYRIYTCQTLADAQDEHELIELFFLPEDQPMDHSEVILADEGLTPPSVLVEGASEITV